MTKEWTSLALPDRLDHLFGLISSPRFLNNQGIGNEVPFFICPFKPEEAVEMARLERQLIKRLIQADVKVLEINLYDLCLNILEREGDLDWLLQNEADMTKSELREELQGILDVETVLVPEIASLMAAAEFAVMFLTGIGEVFPYIRSHNVLNNLQSTAKSQPTVMFFPGAYTQTQESGASLDLFGRLHDDKYYRAFNIFHCQI
ncbi:MAG: DUF1788 domain-containing protein [Deltaproteobacteria bacterium]|nr:DUF1788 domain-containing protein [Deltaproteobacteria bacterium]